MRKFDRKLVLEDGTEFYGYGFGGTESRVCQLVFCTAMVGYQELISDPSCADQLVVMTYPIIGSYGMADDDFETKTPVLGGLVVREYNDNPSNFRYTKTLSEILEENHIPAIEGVDTRMLTRRIRDQGSGRAILCDADTGLEQALELLRQAPTPRNQVARVSCKKRWYSRTSGRRLDVVAVDCGVKLNLLRCLNRRGCNVTVVPYNTSAAEILAMKPDGVLLSNGPGNPEDVPEVEALVKALRGRVPMFGVGLGHQLLARSYGAGTYSLKFGHHGGNHPVQNLLTGQLEITGQGHGYAVDESSLSGTGLEITHRNLLDQTVEGVQCRADRVFSVQYHPEGAPGPQDGGYLFDQFVQLMMEGREHA